MEDDGNLAGSLAGQPGRPSAMTGEDACPPSLAAKLLRRGRWCLGGGVAGMWWTGPDLTPCGPGRVGVAVGYEAGDDFAGRLEIGVVS